SAGARIRPAAVRRAHHARRSPARRLCADHDGCADRDLPHRREELTMPQYLLGIYQPDTDEVPDNLDEIMRDLDALNTEIQEAGAWVFAAGLHAPSASTVVRAEGAQTLITDGPYIEAK